MKKTTYIFALALAFVLLTLQSKAQKAAPQLLTPTNHTLVLIDHESQMGFAVKSIGIEELRHNTGLVSGGSKIFNVPVIVTTVAEKSFSGPVFRYPVCA